MGANPYDVIVVGAVRRIPDSFRDAELCATALDQVLSGVRSFGEARSRYKAARDEHILPMYEVTRILWRRPRGPRRSWRPGCRGVRRSVRSGSWCSARPSRRLVYPVRTAAAGGAGGTGRFRAVMPASMAPTTDSATFTLAHRLSSASTSTHGAAA